MTIFSVARLAVPLLFVVTFACRRESNRPVGWIGRRLETEFGELRVVPNGFGYVVGGVPMVLVADAGHDRMRIMAEVREWRAVSAVQREALMEANFKSTLDARYGREGNMLYALYLHPLSSLGPEELGAASTQVASLVRTFGRSYSSGSLRFGKTPPDLAF